MTFSEQPPLFEKLADRYAERIGQLDQSTQPQILFATLNGTRKRTRKAAFVRQVRLGPRDRGEQDSERSELPSVLGLARAFPRQTEKPHAESPPGNGNQLNRIVPPSGLVKA